MRTVTCITCTILSLWLLQANNVVNAKRILVIAPAPLYSHQIVVRSLCLALRKRGHELVVLTPSPIKNPTLKNYTEIDLSALHPLVENIKHEALKMSQIELIKSTWTLMNKFGTTVFDELEFQKLYKHDSGEKFDAVIAEAVTAPALYALAYRFNAPLIGVMSMGIHNYHRYVFGSPILPSHPSNWELNTLISEDLSIWQRLRNLIDVWDYMYYWINDHIAVQQESVKKYLGSDVPYIIDIMKNMSVLLVNDNPAFIHSRPEQTNAVFFSGLHIEKTPPSLPEGLRRFLDDATEGFIYMSFGSTIRCYHLPKEMQEMFVEVFSKLPYKIVWKFDCELPRKLDNVFTSKWVPQQGVLAHPNIKLFIYQGGLQSTEEAIHYIVPLLGLPVVFEQKNRIMRLSSLGVAIHLELQDLTEKRLDIVIRQIINDKSYKEKMTNLNSLYKDQPYDSMERAIWWVEFVMRHKGAHHLRFSESDKPWYQRYDMDIIALLTTTLFITACVIILIIFQILRFFFKQCYVRIYKSSQQDKKKRH